MSDEVWRKKARDAKNMRCPNCQIATEIVRSSSIETLLPVYVKCLNCGHGICKPEIEAWFRAISGAEV